ncbi:MAG: orotidine 5'-phosphate decarboxylase [Candidatus Micrarchaeota archaeon]|nr:orotidine 5'-phosphate decarboxylase [Candidatus Micrarchaeota archaeon]
MAGLLELKTRYLQIAFNGTLKEAEETILELPESDRIIVEAGTPFIKREGFAGLKRIVELWGGKVVADLKTADGASAEVEMAHSAGAFAATVLGNAAPETLNLFVSECKRRGMISMIDMINVEEPIRVLRAMKAPPDVVVLHKGRDEESTRGKVIRYKHINKIKGKYDVLISAAGGVDLREARSAIFNGAQIVVVNIVSSHERFVGIRRGENVAKIAEEFLATIE